MNHLFLVVDLRIESIVVPDQVGAHERKIRFNEGRNILLALRVQLIPLLVKYLAVLWILHHLELLFVIRSHLESLVKGQRVDFLQNGLESDQ